MNNRTLDLEHTYEYEGKKVFLAFENEMPEVKPLEICGNTGCYPVEEYCKCTGDALLTEDEIYGFACDEVEEICVADFISPENHQYLTSGWVTRSYAAAALVEYKLCVRTNRYYNWTSELTDFIKKVERKAVDGCITTEQSKELEEEWNEILADTMADAEKMLSNSNDCAYSYSADSIPTFEDIIKHYADVVISDDEDEE